MAALKRRADPLRPAAAGSRLAGPLLPHPPLLHGEPLAQRQPRHLLPVRLALAELLGRAQPLRHPVHPQLRVLGAGDADLPAARLPAGVRDRLQGGEMAARDAAGGGGAVLHHLPDPHPRLGDDPLRRKPGGGRPQLPPARPGPSRPRHRSGRDLGAGLQLPALHGAADLRQPRAAGHAADRGGEGPLLERRHRLLQSDAAALGARESSPGRSSTFIPATGDYVNAAVPRRHRQPDDRQRDPVALPQTAATTRRRRRSPSC